MRNNSGLLDGEQFITINGIKHWCKIRGSKNATTPIIIIHGGPGGNNYVFERTIGPYLEEFATVIYYEQRGCGRSESPMDSGAYTIPILIDDLKGLCEELNIKKNVPLGYSFGGELAFEFALAYPELVEGVIAQAPSNFTDNRRSSFVQVHGFQQVAEGDIKDKIDQLINSDIHVEEKCSRIWEFVDTETVDKLLFHDQKFAKLNRDLWNESNLGNSGLMMKSLLMDKSHYSYMDKLTLLKVPALILTGLYDRNVGLDLNREIASKIPDSELIIFDRSAHFPDIEESERYAKAVRDFLAKVRRG